MSMFCISDIVFLTVVMSVIIIAGEKDDDPTSPSYVPSVFAAADCTKQDSHECRYKAVLQRQINKDEREIA